LDITYSCLAIEANVEMHTDRETLSIHRPELLIKCNLNEQQNGAFVLAQRPSWLIQFPVTIMFYIFPFYI